jgi:APA family basic amino acid/polyamine antiporter
MSADSQTDTADDASPRRHMSLFGATGVGVGAIVGGGILALAGAAFAATGPGAMAAFALNGVIAVLTALSFAEMASKFPESGGTYVFSKKVLSVESAFMVGWVVWFASIVAAALYAVGFAYFALAVTDDLWRAFVGEPPTWLVSDALVTAAAVATTLLLSLSLMRKAAGGGEWVNVMKVAVFGLLILGGLWAVSRQPGAATGAALTPFLSSGFGGLIQAMGFTFIALQGFDLIAAVGGEVRRPTRNVPRAMILSLGIALAIYLPLLFVITTVGVPAGESVAEAAAADPEEIVATAAQQFLGPFGFWLVMAAAVLSMFSALQANLFAASRIAQAMATDRTLPPQLSYISEKRGTPLIAVAVTGGLVGLTLLVLQDVGRAGAAASLIFLITFALAHWTAILVRLRSDRRPPPFRTPLFPLVPAVGGIACLGLAVFQGVVVPSAGLVALAWLAIGGILFLGLFAQRARVTAVSNAAFNPELVTLRGHAPLVLVPIANPNNAEAMITLANALVPAEIGRVMAQTIVAVPEDWQPQDDPGPVQTLHAVHHELLRVAARTKIHVETLTTVAPQPMAEIARAAALHRCDSVLVGLSNISADSRGQQLEGLLGMLDSHVVVLRSRANWRPADARRILIPVAGRSEQQHLRAMLLGSLLREHERDVTFLRVLPTAASADDVARARRDLNRLAADEVRRPCNIEVVQHDDAMQTVIEHAADSDLVIVGVQRLSRRNKLFGKFTLRLAQETTCPLLVISRRG